MWESVDHVNMFLAELKETHPEMVRKFMEKEYEALNGKHINEWLARKIVQSMYHTAPDGKLVSGKAVTPEEAMALVADMPQDKQAQCKWDAYVAANAFAHDLATAGFNKAELMKAAKAFWFHDDDMADKNKVYWYFRDLIFG